VADSVYESLNGGGKKHVTAVVVVLRHEKKREENEREYRELEKCSLIYIESAMESFCA